MKIAIIAILFGLVLLFGCTANVKKVESDAACKIAPTDEEKQHENLVGKLACLGACRSQESAKDKQWDPAGIECGSNGKFVCTCQEGNYDPFRLTPNG